MKDFYHFQKSVNTSRNVVHAHPWEKIIVDSYTTWNVGGIATKVDLGVDCAECGKNIKSGQPAYTDGKSCRCAECFKK